MTSSRISSETVQKATGKPLQAWFSILDKAGAKEMKHKQIAEYIYYNHLEKIKSGDWWSQMVTVEYERERGLRKVNEKADGFSVTVHRTVLMSMATLQKRWEEIVKSPEVAQKKLVQLRSKTKRPVRRYQAELGRVIVFFEEKSKDKSRIMVESEKLPKHSDVEPARAFWKSVLSLLDSG